MSRTSAKTAAESTAETTAKTAADRLSTNGVTRVRCPQCAAQYALSAERLPASGQLQCGRCGTRWTLAGLTGLAATLAPTTGASPEPERPKEPARPKEPGRPIELAELTEAAQAQPPRPELPRREIDEILDEIERQPLHGADTKSAHPRGPFILVFCAAILLVSLFLVAWAYLSKPDLFDRLTAPVGTLFSSDAQTDPTTSAGGLPTRAGDAPIPIANRQYRIEERDDGSRLLILTGTAINNTADPVVLGPLMAELKRADGVTVDRWSFAIPEGTLAPGQVADFDNRKILVDAGRVAVRVGWASDFEAERQRVTEVQPAE